jgi:hypothetical protein
MLTFRKNHRCNGLHCQPGPGSNSESPELSPPIAIADEGAQKAIIAPMKSRFMFRLHHRIYMSSFLNIGKDW